MTTTAKPPDSGGQSSTQPTLPFNERDLLAVRLLPAEFARAVGVSRQTVSRWVHTDKVTLGGDGRLNPTTAMRQLLRTGNIGLIRARLVRQAFADMGHLRERAALADELEKKVAALTEQIEVERFKADIDYETIERWLDEFKRQTAAAPLDIRAKPDAGEWRTYVSDILTRVMDDGLPGGIVSCAPSIDEGGGDVLRELN